MNRVFRFQLPQLHFTMLISQTFPGRLGNARFDSRDRRRCRLYWRPPHTAADSFQSTRALLRDSPESKVFGHLALL
jgi:hypothetical protein